MDDDGWKAIQPFATARPSLPDRARPTTTGDLYGESKRSHCIYNRSRGRIASVHVGLAARKEFQDRLNSFYKTAPIALGFAALMGAQQQMDAYPHGCAPVPTVKAQKGGWRWFAARGLAAGFPCEQQPLRVMLI